MKNLHRKIGQSIAETMHSASVAIEAEKNPVIAYRMGAYNALRDLYKFVIDGTMTSTEYYKIEEAFQDKLREIEPLPKG